MIDRNKAFRAWVWNDSIEEFKEIHLVIDVFENGHCLAISEYDAEAYMKHHIQIGVMYYEHYERIPEPKKRLRTRDEILGFIAWNPHIVVRFLNQKPQLPYHLNYMEPIEMYKWASIKKDGEIGEYLNVVCNKCMEEEND